jgi:hypothetical protein
MLHMLISRMFIVHCESRDCFWSTPSPGDGGTAGKILIRYVQRRMTHLVGA